MYRSDGPFCRVPVCVCVCVYIHRANLKQRFRHLCVKRGGFLSKEGEERRKMCFSGRLRGLLYPLDCEFVYFHCQRVARCWLFSLRD